MRRKTVKYSKGTVRQRDRAVLEERFKSPVERVPPLEATGLDDLLPESWKLTKILRFIISQIMVVVGR